MKKTFGLDIGLLALLAVAALMAAPAAAQDSTPPDNGGDLNWVRHQLREQVDGNALDAPEPQRLRNHTQNRNQLKPELLACLPPNEEPDGGLLRHRVQVCTRHSWLVIPGLSFALIWPGLR
ncbi:MAG: hypothetical protein R6X35_01925 [Candidatus Krumholzibacteriia bacterium]